MTRGRPARRRISRRDLGALAVSIALHVVALTGLAARVIPRPVLDAPELPAVELRLVVGLARAAPARAASAPARPAAPAQHREARSSTGRLTADRPTAPAAPIAATSARPTAGDLPAAEMAPDFRGAVRAIVGCSHQQFLALDEREQARCNARLAEAVRNSARVDALDPDLRTHLDSAAAYAARKRANMEGPLAQPVVACPPGEPGSNLAGGCLPPEAIHRAPF